MNQHFERLRVVFLGPVLSRRVVFGFDKNDYPGDEHMLAWTHGGSLSFTGYFLNKADTSTAWSRGTGVLSRRAKLRRMGWGIAPLFYGRKSGDKEESPDAADDIPVGQGTTDAKEAIASARKDGFGPSTRIYLDVEDSGFIDVKDYYKDLRRYLAEWFAVFKSTTDNPTGLLAGVYCSPLDVTGITDIANTASITDLAIWVHRIDCNFAAVTDFTDYGAPFPDCRIPSTTKARKRYDPASRSGTNGADVWQYAQSPRYYAKPAAKGCGFGEPEVVDSQGLRWCDLARNCSYAVGNKCSLSFGGGYTTSAATCGADSGSDGAMDPAGNYDCVPAFAGDFRKFTTYVDLDSMGIGPRPVLSPPIPGGKGPIKFVPKPSAKSGLDTGLMPELELSPDENILRKFLELPAIDVRKADEVAALHGVSVATLMRWRRFVGNAQLQDLRLILNLKTNP